MDENKKDEPPKVGDGATYGCWTDRHAGTVIKVSKSGKTVWVQADHAKRVDKNGMSEMQTYEYSPNPEGHIIVFTLRNDGRYNEKGCARGYGNRVGFGHRNAYHDYSF